MTEDSPVVRRTNKEQKWEAWCGELSGLERLARIVEELATARRAAMYYDPPEPHDLAATLTVRDGADESTGPIGTMLGEIDRRSVDEVIIKDTFHGYSDKLSIKFLRNELGGGVQLRVESSDQGWAKLAIARISDEVEKGVPFWSKVHTSLGRSLVSLTVALIAFITLTLILRGFAGTEVVVLVGILVAWFTFSVIFLMGSTTYNWFFPRFELTGEGANSSGTRRIVVLVTLLASIPVGIFVNIIS